MAVVYVVLGIIVAVLGGTIIEKLHMEKYVEEFIRNASGIEIEAPKLTKKGSITVCKDTSRNDLSEGVSIYFGRSRDRSCDPQLDSGTMD